MLAVIGTFRFPLEQIDEARGLMTKIIEETRQEEGCSAYSYAQAVDDPGLFHVTELWADRASLDLHFDTPHMRDWVSAREALGFHDRRIKVYPLGMGEEL